MDTQFNKILIAADDSKHSVAAVATGYALARAAGAEVALVHVVDIAVTTGDVMSGTYVPEMAEAAKESGQQLLADLAKNHAQEVKTDYFVPEDRPVHGILQVAAEWQAELIVIGTHGRTGLNHLLMGSVAEQVVRKAKIPVLVVPRKSE